MRVERQESRVESKNRILRLRSHSGPRPSTLDPRLSPHGLTLIELLVVIIILTTLVSAAIPILAPTNDDRRLREASRGVNSFISGAQMKAIQLQRPFGIALKRLSLDTNPDPIGQPIHEDNAVCVEMFYVEQPAAYRGFDRTSSAMVARHTNTNKTGSVLIQFTTRGTDSNTDGLPVGWDADLIPPGLIRPHDVIEIDGTRYELVASNDAIVTSRATIDNEGFFRAVSSGSAVRLEAQPLNDTGQMLNVEFDDNGRRMRDLGPSTAPPPQQPYWTNPAPYKILRQPMPTSDEPFQLPEGTAIDLQASGVGADEYFYVPGIHDNPDNIVIMFAPEGRVSRVIFSEMPADPERFDEPVTDNLFLLVGRRENCPAPPEADDKSLTLTSGQLNALNEQQMQELKEAVNWMRGESRWIAIGSQSGRVVTVENGFVDAVQLAVDFSIGGVTPNPRRTGQIDVARELAREMTQTGGK